MADYRGDRRESPDRGAHPMRRRSVAVLAAVIILVLPILAAPVLARDPARVKHEQTLAYWTPARIAAAIPRDFERNGDAFKALKTNKEKGKPPGGGGGGGTLPTVTGASWTKGGPILESTGKVVFTMSGNNYICSGTVVKDGRDDVSIVLTAAHCAYDEVARKFATNWLFIPNFDAAPTYTCGSTKYGCWTASALVVHKGYATAGSFNTQATEHDFAFAIVGGGGKSSTDQLDGKVPAWDIAFNAVSTGDHLYAFGYPAAGKYKGKDLTYCAGKVFQDQWNANKTWGMGCNMTGGSSGGPWIKGFSETATTPSGALSSLNSYGYSGVNNMYGPKFDNRTQAVFSTANTNGTSTDTIVQ
jgi:hypothetical protein